MNWQKEAVNDLREYGLRKESLENIRERYSILQEQFEGIHAVTSDSTPVMGGGCKLTENMINNIAERKRLQQNYQTAKRLISLTETALSVLDNRERIVLERLYIHHNKGTMQQLIDELHVEQSQIYRIKNIALRKFTLALYGMLEL